MEVIFASAAQKGCVLNLPSLSSLRDQSSSVFSPFFSYGGQDYRLSLLGEHQLKNAVTAIEAAHVLRERGFSAITASAIEQGLACAFLPARLESVCCWPQGPQLLLDGAHNAHGCRAPFLFSSAREEREKRISDTGNGDVGGQEYNRGVIRAFAAGRESNCSTSGKPAVY